MIHYAVWVWIPFVTSITKKIISMIWAPPIIVFISDAWPGQSTSVNCKYSYLIYLSILVGTLVKNAEKPRSKVIPLYCDCGFLSRLAVDVISLKMRQIEVFPESTCPKTPTLMLMHLLGCMPAISYLVRSSSSFSIDTSIIWTNYKSITCFQRKKK